MRPSARIALCLLAVFFPLCLLMISYGQLNLDLIKSQIHEYFGDVFLTKSRVFGKRFYKHSSPRADGSASFRRTPLCYRHMLWR